MYMFAFSHPLTYLKKIATVIRYGNSTTTTAAKSKSIFIP